MHFRPCLHGLIAGAALFAGAAAADDRIENIVSTASRTELPAARVGSAFSVVDRALIERRQAVLASDLLQDLPGVAVSRLGGPGSQTQLRLRGAEANHVLVLIDGMPVNDPAAADEFSFEQFTSWDLERIELIRGPQSALWGSDAMAGAINFITRRDGAAPLSAAGFAEGGSFDSRRAGLRAGGGRGRFSGTASLSWFETDGENIARQGDERDGYENLTLGLHTAFEVSEQLALELTARHTDASADFDDTFATGLPTDADLVTDTRYWYLQGAAELALQDGRWRQRLTAHWLDSERKNRDAGRLTDRSDGERSGLRYQSSWALGKAPDRYQLTAAIDYEKEEFAQAFPGNPFLSAADQRQSRNSTGLVAELQAQPLPGLDLNGSLRHDLNSDFKDKTTLRLTAAWRPDAGATRLHASYGTGMKKPTFTELFGFFPASFVGNPDLKPEESSGFDIGIDQRFFDDRLRADLTWFYAELENEIQTVFLPGFRSSVVNGDGRSRRQGIELELQARLTPALRATASYTYTEASEPDASGRRQREIRRPRHMAAVNLDYGFAGDRGDLNLNLSYTGDQLDRDFSRFPSPLVTLDDYLLVNLAASYALGERWSVYARAENLLDEDYENVFGYRNPGRAFYAGIRAGFGQR